MSENNNNGKKNFFKRLSGFKKFLVIYASALVVIIAVALVLLYGLLKDYEAGRPANTMDKLVSHIEAGNVGKWIKDAGILGEFETEDIVSDYFKDTFADKEVSYKKKAGEYTENNPVYILYADDKKIANVTLTEKKKNAHKFTEWKLASIDFNVDSKTKNTEHSVKITAPKNSEVTINGVKVSSDYITGEADASTLEIMLLHQLMMYTILTECLPSQRLRLPIMAKSLILNMLKMDMRHIIHQMMSFFQARRAIY